MVYNRRRESNWAQRGLVMVALFILVLGTRTMAGSQQLVGSEWRPLEIAGEVLPADAPLFIRFDGSGKVQGHGGCNALFGPFLMQSATLRIGPLATTRKGCQPETMKREASFVAALQNTRLFLRDGSKLTLKDAQGVTTLRLVQSDWD